MSDDRVLWDDDEDVDDFEGEIDWDAVVLLQSEYNAVLSVEDEEERLIKAQELVERLNA